MIESIRQLQKDILQLISSVKAVKAKQIYHKTIIQKCKELVDQYFRDTREKVNGFIDDELLHSLDDSFQTLLITTHKKSLKSTYLSLLSNIKKELISLEKFSLLSPSKTTNIDEIDKIDRQILDTLNVLLPSAALSYEQSIVDLQTEKRLSWRGPATDLRESLRECLDYLAPDKDVTSQPGFKLVSNTNGPTMKQKVKYILKNRGIASNKIKTSEDAMDLIEEMLGSFVRSVYTRASISTHTPTDKKEVNRIKYLVRIIFCELLEIE